MKQTMKFIAKILVAAMVAMGVALVLVWQGASFNAVAIVYLCTAIGLALAMGAFDVEGKQQGKCDSIRHYDGRRNYGQAAVFIGTACLFMGTPEQCEEMCDDLWHWGQQARMETLTGDEVFDVL